MEIVNILELLYSNSETHFSKLGWSFAHTNSLTSYLTFLFICHIIYMHTLKNEHFCVYFRVCLQAKPRNIIQI